MNPQQSVSSLGTKLRSFNIYAVNPSKCNFLYDKKISGFECILLFRLIAGGKKVIKKIQL